MFGSLTGACGGTQAACALCSSAQSRPQAGSESGIRTWARVLETQKLKTSVGSESNILFKTNIRCSEGNGDSADVKMPIVPRKRSGLDETSVESQRLQRGVGG